MNPNRRTQLQVNPVCITPLPPSPLIPPNILRSPHLPSPRGFWSDPAALKKELIAEMQTTLDAAAAIQLIAIAQASTSAQASQLVAAASADAAFASVPSCAAASEKVEPKNRTRKIKQNKQKLNSKKTKR